MTLSDPAPARPQPAAAAGWSSSQTSSPGRTARVLWAVSGGALALFSIANISLTLVGLLALHRVEQTVALTDLDGIETIRIRADSGSVDLVGTSQDGGEATGELSLRGDLRSPSHDQRVEGTTLVLESDCPTFATIACTADYRLTVPADMTVEVALSGRTEIDGVHGALTVDSSGGPILVTDSAGPLRLTSSGGDITVVDSGGEQAEFDSSGGSISASFAEPPRNLVADSAGGHVSVRVPRSSAPYAVDVETGGGSSTVEVATDAEAERTMIIHTSGGDAALLYHEAAAGSG